MSKVWENKLDNKYDVMVESDDTGYRGFLIIKEGNTELLREETTISFGARFGPDMGDVMMWETLCAEFIDKRNKE